MPIPEYQASSGAVIFRMTPEERMVAEANEIANNAKKKTEEVHKDYAVLKNKYDNLEGKYAKLIEHLGLDPEDFK